MLQGQYRTSRRGRPSEDRARREHNSYAEGPSKLAKAYEAGLERTRLRLEQQREDLARRARVRAVGVPHRHDALPQASSGRGESAEGPRVG
jgi:hypothetical protein